MSIFIVELARLARRPLAALSIPVLLAACVQGGAPVAAPQVASAPVAVPRYPVAAARPVTHAYHGVSVTDDFEWLEDAADPAVKGWVAQENAASARYFDALAVRPELHERLTALLSSTSNSYYGLVERGGVIFAMKNAPPKQQPMLVTLASVDDPGSEKVVFDPNEAAANGSLEIDFFVPSLDGRRVALSVSENGSEDGTLRILDVATGHELPDRVPRVAYPTGGGSVAWSTGGEGLYYTQYPVPGSRPAADEHFYQQVYYHRLGTPATQDRAEVGAEFPRIAETALQGSRDGKVIVALVANGDGGDFSLWLKTPDAHGAGPWRRIAADADGVKAVQIGDDDALYLLSRADTPRGRILRLPVGKATATVDWKRVPTSVPQSDGNIEHFAVAGPNIAVSELLGGPSRLSIVNIRTHKRSPVALPPISAVEDIAVVGHNDIVAELGSYLVPPNWSHVFVGRNGVRRTALVVTSEANFNDTEVVREFATSKDGTKIPLNIIRRKGTRLDGRNPTILYGYGGYGLSQTPGFTASRRVWLDRGGVYVVANIRGGAEFGETWHTGGNLTHKQNVFDDFIASAEYLIQHGYTNPQKLGILGGSNGGLLMGAVMTQRPELFRAVGSAVGIYDMLRVELDPNGAFNVTEFGSVKDEDQFRALYAYSPLHHVRNGVDYPAVLMETGDNDGRVNPAHSRKMIARLQQADPNGRPLLLRTTAAAGHGIGSALSVRIDQGADLYAFFVNELIGATP
ncbi:MAG TPA: prolyl oligopeptidase family serine peptidase [Burkholderiaceae bacterium]|nr:prolyl oligopeptidase family serine peptidase [Burkholderiaceae bacterium]